MTIRFPAPATRRRVAVISCLALATLGTTAPASSVRGHVRPLGACSLRPSIDGLPFDADFEEAWRVRDGVTEILHDVRCSDGRVDRVWIAADII